MAEGYEFKIQDIYIYSQSLTQFSNEIKFEKVVPTK